MIGYCRKTGQVYNVDLKFQQPLKDVWSTALQKIQLKQTQTAANDNRPRTTESK